MVVLSRCENDTKKLGRHIFASLYPLPKRGAKVSASTWDFDLGSDPTDKNANRSDQVWSPRQKWFSFSFLAFKDNLSAGK